MSKRKNAWTYKDCNIIPSDDHKSAWYTVAGENKALLYGNSKADMRTKIDGYFRMIERGKIEGEMNRAANEAAALEALKNPKPPIRNILLDGHAAKMARLSKPVCRGCNEHNNIGSTGVCSHCEHDSMTGDPLGTTVKRLTRLLDQAESNVISEECQYCGRASQPYETCCDMSYLNS